MAKRAKVIHAEGEMQAAGKLPQATRTPSGQPEAMQLRDMQTLALIAGDKSNTNFFSIDLAGARGRGVEGMGGGAGN